MMRHDLTLALIKPVALLSKPSYARKIRDPGSLYQSGILWLLGCLATEEQIIAEVLEVRSAKP